MAESEPSRSSFQPQHFLRQVEQFVGVEGFGHVLGGAHLKAALAVHLLALIEFVDADKVILKRSEII